MAQFNHRVNLKEAEFPLLTSELGRTVLVSNNRSTPTGEEQNKPTILYMHNVMPTARGLQSTRFSKIAAAPSGADVTSEIAGIIFVPFTANATPVFSGNGRYIAYEDFASGNTAIYLLRPNDNLGQNLWYKEAVVVRTVYVPTVATVNSKSYILINDILYHILDSIPLSLVANTIVGAPFAFRGITSSFGYIIAWATVTTQVAWSSLVNPLDFTPSAATGAGNGSVEGLRGFIVKCVPNSTGFIVYSKNNAVAAIYTGNKQFPFKFVVVEGSRGLETPVSYNDVFPTFHRVAEDDDSYGHFVYTEQAGLQLTNSKKAETILPEVTNFLAGAIVEDYDEATKTFSVATTASDLTLLQKAIAYIGARYLVISYGLTELTHALIYDFALKRMGKVKITHIQALEFLYRPTLDTSRVEVARSQIGFLTKEGSISVLRFEKDAVANPLSGTLILGKYQYHRDRMLHLHNVTAENIEATDSFTLTDRVSLDGRNVSSIVEGTETAGTPNYREYYFQNLAGKNHSLALTGAFTLSTLELLFTIGGRR